MRRLNLSRLGLSVGFALSLSLLVGCGGSGSGPAKPEADMDELQQYLSDNPDQDVDDPDGDMAEMAEDDAAE
jgi:hypothetical protein